MKIWYVLAVLLMSPVSSFSLANHDLVGQRQKFLEAEQLLRDGNLSAYHVLRAELDRYPLSVYLDYQFMVRSVQAHRPMVEYYLADWASTPLGVKLRTKWLQYLAAEKAWADYRDAYKPSNDVALQCHYLYSLIKTDEGLATSKYISRLWEVGSSQPTSCDPVFSYWQNSQMLKEGHIWRRFLLSIEKNEIGMASYLIKFLGPDFIGNARLWLKVRKNPSLVTNQKLFSDTPIGREILLSGLHQLIRRAPDIAQPVWYDLQEAFTFSERDKRIIQRRLGLSYLREHQVTGLAWLNKLPDEFVTRDVREWRILGALREQDWKATELAIERLPSLERQQPRWQYWLARAKTELGDHEKAFGLYSEIAHTRGYYSFLAADKINKPYNFNNKSLQYDSDIVETMRRHPALERARELFRLNRFPDARREWNTMFSSLGREQKFAAAKLADEWGWHSRAISAVGSIKEFDDLELRFPVTHSSTFGKYTDIYLVELGYTLAVARQESIFVVDARSPSGALGIMQIMPTTGQYIATNLVVPSFKVQHLLNPQTNIRYGIWYLRKLLDSFDEHIALSTAAYNAGPGRVRSWVPEKKSIPADIWVETIPFDETRRYVRRVLEYTTVYEMMIAQNYRRLSSRLPAVVPRP